MKTAKDESTKWRTTYWEYREGEGCVRDRFGDGKFTAYWLAPYECLGTFKTLEAAKNAVEAVR